MIWSALPLMIPLKICGVVVVQLLSHIRLFCDPVDCSPPGSSVHWILQSRILEWFVISFSRDLPNPRIKLPSPALAGRFFAE